MCGIKCILPFSNNWLISAVLWIGLLLTDCNLSSCLQSVSMDWSDDICFLCARMAPSICCLCLINKPINEEETSFQHNQNSYTANIMIWTYLRFFISLLITDACCVSFLTCSAQPHTGGDILVIAENLLYFRKYFMLW